MNKKLSLSDIADQLAENAKISKKDAAIFLKNLFDMVEENLIAQKIVKIKGLGTFKLTRMESRKIANVNTGEIQEIPEHYKTTFTPDTALAEAVNEPFAHLETMILDDESIADQPTVVKPEPIEVKTETVKVATPPVEPAPSTEKSETTVTEINTSAETEILEKTKESKSKNGIHWIYYLIGLIVFVCATYIGCKFCKFNEPKTPVIASIPIQTKDSVAKKVTKSFTEQKDTSANNTSIAQKEKVTSEKRIIATETMKEGSRLTLISLKYYGNKAFWVYIYDTNKDVIPNPNKVATGTTIKIPSKEAYNIDANNPESIAKAKTLEYEILKAQH